MKSSSVIGIALLVIAGGLAVYEPFLQKIGESTSVSAEPTPLMSTTVGDGPTPLGVATAVLPTPLDPNWEASQPRHEPIPKRRHPVNRRHAKSKPKPVPKSTEPDQAPLAAPTFLPSTPEPATPMPEPVEVVTPRPMPHPSVRVIEEYHPPVVHRRPRPKPTIYAPPTPSARDLARQRQLERAALVDAAVRSARGTVQSTVAGVNILSADADDHGTYISVVVVESRPGGTLVESFVFTPGPSALGLAQRRVISQTTGDPYVSH